VAVADIEEAVDVWFDVGVEVCQVSGFRSPCSRQPR
jgi:MOSC domain-containing protein YiiM